MKQSRLNLLLVTQVRFVHRYCMRRWSKLPDNSIEKMHKVQERRCATPTPLKIGIGYRFTYCFARLEDREPKVLERSDKKVVKMVKAIAKRKALVLLWAQDKGLGGLGVHY